MALSNFAGRIGNESEDGQRRDAFAATAFADDGESLAGVNVIRDAIDGLDLSFVGEEGDLQVFNRQ